ncbi:shikimate kinase [Nocardia thailandica]|uniref:Shikimate kinase n=1 Tax=Nocardia thailandica TaxID=257275 RepID=A0ABW6PNY5_9NOCA
MDTDYGGWTEELPNPDGTGLEPRWRETRIDALIAAHEQSGETLFIAGTVSNQVGFYRRFDAIVLLSAPVEVILERIARRDTNPFGKAAAERDRIVADISEIQPLLRSAATTEIDTSKPLAEVVDQLASLADPPPRPRR